MLFEPALLSLDCLKSSSESNVMNKGFGPLFFISLIQFFMILKIESILSFYRFSCSLLLHDWWLSAVRSDAVWATAQLFEQSPSLDAEASTMWRSKIKCSAADAAVQFGSGLYTTTYSISTNRLLQCSNWLRATSWQFKEYDIASCSMYGHLLTQCNSAKDSASRPFQCNAESVSK